MKKIFYLMSVACLMMVASCDKNNENDNPAGGPKITIPAGEQTAGGTLVLRAEGLDEAAVFSLKSEKGQTTALEDVTVSASGADITLPYTLGEYTLVVEQNNAVYEPGKITIAVTGVKLPESAKAGEEITIAGNGFASDAKIFINGNEANTIADETGVKVTVPAEVNGECEVKVVQAGTEQPLGKLNVIGEVRKRLTNVSIGGELDFSVTYNGNEPATFFGAEIVKDGDTYNFADLGFTFTVNNNLVSKIDIEGDEYPWEYDENGYVSVINGLDYEYSVYVDENGNYSGDGFACQDLELKNNPDANVDIAILNDALGNSDLAYIAAAMFGWTGKISPNIPSVVVVDFDPETGEPVYAPVKYEFDEDGYVTSYECAELGMEFLYTWEVVE